MKNGVDFLVRFEQQQTRGSNWKICFNTAFIVGCCRSRLLERLRYTTGRREEARSRGVPGRLLRSTNDMRATETDALMTTRREGTLVDAEASTASRGNDESGGIGKSFRKYSDVDEEKGEE